MHRGDLLAFGTYLLLGVWVMAEHWADVTHRISAHLPTDHSWFEWLFSHGAYSLRHLENPLFSARQNVPDGVNLMANTSLLGVTLPMAPITWLLGPQYSYVIYLSAALAATASTSYWVLSRYLVRSRTAAFVGGAFLGFAPGVIHHANGQPNFASNFLLPIIVARVLRLGTPPAAGSSTGGPGAEQAGASADRPAAPGRVRWLRDGVVLGLLVAYQIFINEEMLLLTALACAVIVVAYAVQRPAAARARLVPFLRSLGTAAVLALLLVGYPIWFQFNGAQSYRGLQGGVFHSWGEDVWAFVTYARDTLAGSPAVEATIGRTEQNTWFGWPLVCLAVLVTVLLWRVSLPARIAAVVGALFAVASLGPQIRFNGELTELDGPWRLIPPDVPLVEMMMPTRLSLVTAGAIGVLLALAWDHVATLRAEAPTRAADAGQSTAPGSMADAGQTAGAAAGPGSARRVRVLAYAAVALALVPLIPRPLPTKPVDPPPRFITSGAWRDYVPPGRTLVPVPIPSNVHGLSTLRWSALTRHEFPVPGGYFIGPGPQGEGIFGAPSRPTTALIYRTMDARGVPVLTDDDRARAIEDLRYWKAAVVVLGKHDHEADLLALMTGLLGPAQRVDDVWLWDFRSQDW